MERSHGFNRVRWGAQTGFGGRQDAFMGPFTLWGNIALQHLRARQFWLNYMQ